MTDQPSNALKVQSFIDRHWQDFSEEDLLSINEQVIGLLKIKRHYTGSAIKTSLNIGDTVRFTGGKPQYLRGQTAVITKKNPTKAEVRLVHGPVGKFRSGIVICPYSLLEKVS